MGEQLSPVGSPLTYSATPSHVGVAPESGHLLRPADTYRRRLELPKTPVNRAAIVAPFELSKAEYACLAHAGVG